MDSLGTFGRLLVIDWIKKQGWIQDSSLELLKSDGDSKEKGWTEILNLFVAMVNLKCW